MMSLASFSNLGGTLSRETNSAFMIGTSARPCLSLNGRSQKFTKVSFIGDDHQLAGGGGTYLQVKGRISLSADETSV
jgi:hypothetical protein